MKKHLFTRLLSLLLVLALCAGFATPVYAQPNGKDNDLTFRQVDNDTVTANWFDGEEVLEEDTAPYADTEYVRVSILLEGESAIGAGFALQSIAQNEEAVAYRKELRTTQASIQAAIEQQVLDGQALDVSWNLTLAANLISCDVPYGKISEIEKIDGVKTVILETRYEPAVVERSEVNDPNMSTSPIMIGTSTAYASGYTGAGSRIAVIDTGTDTDHQSFSAEGFQYSLSKLADAADMTTEEYISGLDLLDLEEIASVLDQLHVAERRQVTAEELYGNAKLPFGFNYIDNDLDLTHDNDEEGEHGSHVAGIAAANTYIPDGEGGFKLALDAVLVQGVAPDAQLITMKVFGKNGGAYDSDYMAAMEDAIVLGCDAINLSLGSAAPGSATVSPEYRQIVENIMNSGTVVAIAAGNNYAWADYAENGGYLYSDDVSMTTLGTPASYPFSMAVASVNNVGYTRNYFSVGETPIFYTERLSPFTQVPLATLDGTYEYIWLDRTGGLTEFDDLQDVIQGRILVCSRGESDFVSKASGAVLNGAIGTIVYNNQPGVFYMDLNFYAYTPPCVAISQADGEAMRQAATKYTHENGSTYYIGTLTAEGLAGNEFLDDPYTMSDFSSWGVPGDLSLKPEITAPGSDIYSVDGLNPNGKSYETMSGTSMATPQIAGMAALVAQYIEAEGLEEKTGLTARQLTHSLLMSTAEPIKNAENNDYYYSVMNQGAGLANVGAAVSADSYILMNENATATAADGKVKVELGHDPERTGEYTFSFTLNNLEDQVQTFELSANFFTQGLIEGIYGEGEEQATYMLLDKLTTPINTTVTWTVDGKTLTPGSSVQGMDFDADGDVDELDGQALLDYAIGLRAEVANADKADLDADGDIDSHDAYLFFTQYSAGVLTLPAEGKAEVTVTVALTEDQKAELDEHYVNGAYVEGFIFVEELTSAEGALGTRHSIPVLGFYGDWSDPSMFEVGTYATYRTGEEKRIPYTGYADANNISVAYAGDPGHIYYFGGNFVIADATYHPERNAMNSENGDMIARAYFTPIRNVAASRLQITNEATGEVLYETFGEALRSTYEYGSWRDTHRSFRLNWAPAGLAEDETFRVSLTLATEVHMAEDGSVNWDVLGEGATISMPITIDNTAPTLEEVAISLTGNELIVTASDNQYIAGVALFDGSGNYVLGRVGAHEDIQPGESAEYRLSLEDVNSTKLILQVVDYAYNVTTYTVEQSVGEPGVLPQYLAYVYKEKSLVAFGEEDFDAYTFWKSAEERVDASTMVDNMLYTSTTAGNLYVINAEANYEEYFVDNLGWYPGDMAYNPVDGYIYAVLSVTAYSIYSDIIYTFLRIDKMTGEVTVMGELPILANALACDGNGTFYCVKYQTGELYSFTLDNLSELTYVCTVDDVMKPMGDQSMEWDYNENVLRWSAQDFANWSFKYRLITIDVATGVSDSVQTKVIYEALAVPTKGIKTGSWIDPTDQITVLKISQTEADMLVNSEIRLDINVLPWNITDRSVTWSSSDPAVATVDSYGKVTAIAPGSAVITATSNLDSTKTATCAVTVSAVEATITGITQNADGNASFFTWNMAEDKTATMGDALGTSIIAAADIPGRDSIYVVDNVIGTWGIHEMDQNSGEIIRSSKPGKLRLPLWDLSYNTNYSNVDAQDRVLGLYQTYVFPAMDPMNMDDSVLDLSRNIVPKGAEFLLAMASAGYAEYYRIGTYYDSEHVFLLDNIGNISELYIYTKSDGSMTANFTYYTSNLLDAGLELYTDEVEDYTYASMVVGEDGALYVSVYNGITCDLFHLAYQAETKSYYASKIGTIGNGPTALLTADSNLEAEQPDATNGVSLDDACFTTVSEILENQSLQPTGNLNSIVEEEPVEGENTVTLTVTAKDINGTDVATNNGVMTLTYDPSVLTLKSVVVGGDYRAVDESTAGEVTFGYVSLAGFQASDAVATFTFVRSQCAAGTTELTLTHREVNADHPNYTETLELHYAHNATEVRGAKEATCTEDGYTGDTYCTVCNELLIKGEVIPAYCPTANYTDVPLNAWYHEAVDYVVESGIMEGTGEGIFAPESTSTRAQMVTVLYRLEGEPEVELTGQFTDVAEGQWYAEAVAWAYANDITTGITDTLFAPNAAVTREQVVVFLARYAQFKGIDTASEYDLGDFADAAAVKEYAVPAFRWAVENDIINGIDGRLAPTAASSRAQIAAILMRFMELGK